MTKQCMISEVLILSHVSQVLYFTKNNCFMWIMR